MEGNYSIEADGLVRDFGGRRAVDGVDLRLERGLSLIHI